MRESKLCLLVRGFRVGVVLTGFFLVAIQPRVSAEVPPLSAEQQRSRAKTIVVGDICKVETHEKMNDWNSVDTVYELDIKVVACEKGACREGEMLHARCWRMKAREIGTVGATGQWYVPQPDQRVRAYLDGDGLLTPNGLDLLVNKQAGANPFEARGANLANTSWYASPSLGIALGVLVVIFALGFVTGWFWTQRRYGYTPKD